MLVDIVTGINFAADTMIVEVTFSFIVTSDFVT